MKLRQSQHGDDIAWIFHCPGCGFSHAFDDRWDFNGDTQWPTFKPSLLNRTDDLCCHLFVEDGTIRYLDDCSHELAGQTVEMIEVDWETVD